MIGNFHKKNFTLKIFSQILLILFAFTPILSVTFPHTYALGIKKKTDTEQDTTQGTYSQTAKKISSQSQIIKNLGESQIKTPDSKAKKQALVKLTELGFELKSGSIELLESNFESAVLNMDILEGRNLDVALKCVLESAVQDTNDKNLCKEIQILCNILESKISSSTCTVPKNKIKNSAGESRILTQLEKIKEILDKSKCNVLLLNFINAVINAYKVRISREAAQNILAKNRTEIEKLMSSKSQSSKLSAPVELNDVGVKIGVEATFLKNESADENSLYRVDREGEIRISFGGKLNKILQAEIGGDVGVTSSVIFYSLEQYLDSKEASGSVLIKSSAVDNIIKSRKELRKKEEQLLSGFKFSIEGYLKSSGIVPDMVYIDWPDITGSGYKYSSKSVKYGADVTASIMSTAGITVQGQKKHITKTRSNPYIALISEDCSPADNFTAEDIRNFFFKDNSESKQGKQATKLPILEKIETLIAEHQNICAILSLILGDLRQYNSAINIMSAQDKALKNTLERDIKHEIEDNWISPKKYYRGGRSQMLKAAVVVASYMQQIAVSEHEVNLLRQIYLEIEQLSKMQNFSRNIKKEPNFDTSYKLDAYSVSGTATIEVPNFQGVKLDVNYENLKGPKIDQEENIDIGLEMPMSGTTVVGIKAVSDFLMGIANRMTLASNKGESQNLGSAFSFASGIISDINNKNDAKYIFKSLVSLGSKASVCIKICLTKISQNNESDLALPGQEKLLKSKPFWALKCIKISNKLSKSTEYTQSCRQWNKVILGTGTFSYILNKYNAFRVGLLDHKKGVSPKQNTLWQAFKANNIKTLPYLFVNIANPNSNARYELQCIFNSIFSYSQEPNKNNFSDIFLDFLNACDKFKQSRTEKDLTACISLLDSVLELQFEKYFLPEFNTLFSIKAMA